MPRAWLLLIAAALLAGCGQPTHLSVNVKTMKAPPQNVISLTPSTTEILSSELQSNQLKGRGAYDNFPAYVATLPVFGGVKPKYEDLAAAKPDLVVLDKSLFSDADLAKLDETVGKDHVFAFHADTLDEFISDLRQLGDRLGSPLTFSAYIDKVDRARAAAVSTAPSPQPKVAVISGELIAGTKTFQADILKSCGGKPSGPDTNTFVPINAEELVQDGPDLIFVGVGVSQYGKDNAMKAKVGDEAVKKFTEDPRFKTLPAVVKHQVLPIDADVLLRQGQRVDQLINALAPVVDSAK